LSDDLRRYGFFGWDYEHFNPLREEEIAWYAAAATKARRPVLELACGSGRLMLALAGKGIAVDGVDLSKRMVDLARKRLAGLPAEMRRRAHVFRADIRAFHLFHKYGLIIIADNSFRNCVTRDEQLACLQCVERHL